MAHYDSVKVIFRDRVIYVHADMIRHYLPGLWRQYAGHFPPTRSIRPMTYLRRVEVNDDTWLALFYLFCYLEAIHRTSKDRRFLEKCLDHTWDTDGHRRGKRVFLALGRILSPQNFGCHYQIWLTMATFVIKHGKETSDWVEYIKALDEIDASGRFDLEHVLRWFPWIHPTRVRDLQTHHLLHTLGPRPLQLLDRLSRESDGNIYRFGSRGGHAACCNFARAKRAWDLDERREEAFPWWTESLDDKVHLIGQCTTCFNTFGPYYTHRRPALPRARSARALRHVAHHDNYEAESSPWDFSDFRRNIPRYMRSFLHDSDRYEDWFPRHARLVEILS